MECKKDPKEVLRQGVLASSNLESFFHQLIKDNGWLEAKDIQEFMADYVIGHSTTDTLVDELDLEHIRCCSECGNPMYEGFCIENGMDYYCSDECLHKNMTQAEYEKLFDDGRGDSYWTVWAE